MADKSPFIINFVPKKTLATPMEPSLIRQIILINNMLESQPSNILFL
jgi:hypothetical protein